MVTLPTTQAFLNAPTLEEARESYLTHWHLPSVKSKWNGRKPTQAQFDKAFGEAYAARQRFIARKTDPVLAEKRLSDIEDVVNALHSSLLGLQQNDDPDEDDDEQDEDDEQVETPNILDAIVEQLKGRTIEVEDEDEPAEVEVEPVKRVQPQNEDKLPTSGLVYFFLHRAIENGDEFAVVPVRRIVASQGRAMFDDGASYDQVIRKLRRSVR